MVNLSLRWLLESPGGQASGIRLIVLFRLIVNFTDSEYILVFYKDGWVLFLRLYFIMEECERYSGEIFPWRVEQQ